MNPFKGLKNVICEYGHATFITILTGEHAGACCIFAKNMEVSGSIWHSILHKINHENVPSIQKIDDTIEVLVERISQAPRLIICGAGHISVPVAKLMNMLEFSVTVIDDREQFLTSTRFPVADKLIAAPFTKALEDISYGENCYFVIVTRGHQADRECLEYILKNKFGYVGMIGSKGKVKIVLDKLRENNVSEHLLAQVYSPIGLEIEAETPAEIAVSIAAEIIKHKSEKQIGTPIDTGVLDALCNPQTPAMLATIIRKSGSAPRGIGSRMLVMQNGEFFGTIGGGNAEYEVLGLADEVIAGGYPRIITSNMTNDDAANDGMVCGGSVTLFLQPIA